MSVRASTPIRCVGLGLAGLDFACAQRRLETSQFPLTRQQRHADVVEAAS
jgi:hypothetical protein